MASSPWPIIHEERKALLDDLTGLTDAQWSTASLCAGWSVRDVLAHMTAAATVTPPKFFAGFIGSGFRFNAFNDKGVASQLGATPTDTLANFRSRVDATTHPPGPGEAMLGETMVHSADIRRPLGIEHTYSQEGLTRAADFFANSNLLIGGKRRVSGLTLRASDTGWSIGSGPEVTGPMPSLLLAIVGRRAALDDLSGEGLPRLRQQF